jgi:hypothetical protein
MELIDAHRARQEERKANFDAAGQASDSNSSDDLDQSGARQTQYAKVMTGIK